MVLILHPVSVDECGRVGIVLFNAGEAPASLDDQGSELDTQSSMTKTYWSDSSCSRESKERDIVLLWLKFSTRSLSECLMHTG